MNYNHLLSGQHMIVDTEKKKDVDKYIHNK